MKYTETYRGIVIQNNDPKQEGRVKVFVPGINLQQLKNWNQKREEDKMFKVMGQNTKSSLTVDILQNQKDKLFWAEVMLPSIGMSAPGFYHASSDVYYIGNDSDFIFQGDNKTVSFFKKDESDAEKRRDQPITFNSISVPPRTSILLNFKVGGRKFCFNTGCDGNTNIPAFWANSYGNTCLTNLKNSLPSVYDVKPLSSLEIIDDTNETNNTIESIQIDVTSPNILINDVLVNNTSPLYNTCEEPTLSSDKLSYSPPILFENSNTSVSGSLESFPVNILINGKDTLNKKFKLETSDETSITYKSDNVRVVVPISNINYVKIKGKNNNFDISKILALVPIVTSIIGGIIMPRAPMSRGSTMLSRGGGGGEIYNNVTTGLLDEQQRRNSHIGGANNQSKYTTNHGRKSLNDPNNTKGSNIQTNATQIYRGPARAPDYNNDWKGIISIPGVGSHVWVRFENGDPLYPIIIGTFASRADYKGIFELK
jgi:hypothetical protein